MTALPATRSFSRNCRTSLSNSSDRGSLPAQFFFLLGRSNCIPLGADLLSRATPVGAFDLAEVSGSGMLVLLVILVPPDHTELIFHSV